MCKSCSKNTRSEFSSEVAIHFPGLNGLEMPIVWAFPKLKVCLECGFAEFAIRETELRVLREGEVKVNNLDPPPTLPQWMN